MKKRIFLGMIVVILCGLAYTGYYFNQNYVVFSKKFGLCKDNSDCPLNMFCDVKYDIDFLHTPHDGIYAKCQFAEEIGVYDIILNGKKFIYTNYTTTREAARNFCKANGKRLVAFEDIGLEYAKSEKYKQKLQLFRRLITEYSERLPIYKDITTDNIEHQIQKCEKEKGHIFSKKDMEELEKYSDTSIPFCAWYIGWVQFSENEGKNTFMDHYVKGYKFDFWTDDLPFDYHILNSLFGFVGNISWSMKYNELRPLCVE